MPLDSILKALGMDPAKVFGNVKEPPEPMLQGKTIPKFECGDSVHGKSPNTPQVKQVEEYFIVKTMYFDPCMDCWMYGSVPFGEEHQGDWPEYYLTLVE